MLSHPRFLLKATSFAAIRRFLSDGYVYGSKEIIANAIISFFRADTEKILLSGEAETELCRVKGIGSKKVGAMVEMIDNHTDFRQAQR